MKRIIVGAGAFAQIAHIYFEEFTNLKIDAFAVSRDFIGEQKATSLDIIEVESILDKDPHDFEIFIAIGYRNMNKERERLFRQFDEKNFHLLSFVHPNVKKWGNSRLGKNVFVFEDNTMQPYTSIGDNTILWSGNHIGHHTTIEKNCFVSSHVVISGSCRIGKNCFLGVNSTIQDNVHIADFTLVGAGTLIKENTEAGEIYVNRTTSLHSKKSWEIGF